MNKLLLRGGSLAFAVLVTAFLVARAAGCVNPGAGEPASSTTATTAPATDTNTAASAPLDAGTAPVDAGHEVKPRPDPEFLPATKAAMPILRPEPTQQGQTP